MKISDFNISGKPIPEDIADKILEFHLRPLERVQAALPIKIWVSAKSGYRSYEWEKSKGRPGNSQHCFYGKGAADVTCEGFEKNKYDFLKAIVNNTSYTRICEYNSFFHLDYGLSEERWVFKNISGNWIRQYEITQ